MEDVVDRLLARTGGAASRSLLLRAGLTTREFDREVRRGALVRVFPRSYCRPWDVDDIAVREQAAVMSLGMPAALSHLSSLRRWELLKPPDCIHVTVPPNRGIDPGPELIVHRVRRFPKVIRLHGVVTTTAAEAITASWPMLAGADQRGPAITAVRSRVTSTDELRSATARLVRLPGRRELLRLIDLLDAGCQSELEIWGYLSVFSSPGLDHARRQLSVHAGGRTYRLDLAYEAGRVAVELDGDRFHSTPEQRERDRRRDAALAAIGWVTLRFSHRRLHRDVAGCRRDTLQTLGRRR